MKYSFLLNGEVISRTELSELRMLSEEFEELLETGSVAIDSKTVLQIVEAM